MKKITCSLCLLTLGIALASQASATTSLLQVYRDALKNDPTFQQALANRDISSLNVPLNLANLLPNISVQGTGALQKTLSDIPAEVTTTGAATDDRQRSLAFGVNLTQNVFNFTDWMQLASAKDSAKAAYATYTYSIQDLIQRTTSAYFNILLARDNLAYTLAEKRAFYRQYIQAKESYEVGIKTITDVDNAKAAYDSAMAGCVAAENNLDNQEENLHAITDKYYPDLAALKILPLITPKPANIDAWTRTAINHNWQLIAANYNSLAANTNIKAAAGGAVPTVQLTGGYNNSYTHDMIKANADETGRTKQLQGQLQVSMPIFTGGQVTSQVKQAIAQYNLALAQQEQTYRSTILSVRQAYLGAISGISQIKADQQAVISHQSSLEGMEEGYKVGTRTIVDVLNSEQNLFDAERQSATDRYNYINSLISLKEAAGTLTINDIALISSWLSGNATPASTIASPTIQTKNSSSNTVALKATHQFYNNRQIKQ